MTCSPRCSIGHRASRGRFPRLAYPDAVDGPWVQCPRCGETVPLGVFAESDEEPGVQVATCTRCGERTTLQPPRHPLGDLG